MLCKTPFLALLLPLFFFSCAENPHQKINSNEQSKSDIPVKYRVPSEYTAYFVENDSLKFESINHSIFRLYFFEETYSDEELKFLTEELDEATERVFEILDVEDYPFGSHILLVESEEKMEELMGYHIKGGAAKGHDLLFIVSSDSVRPQFKHEYFHLASYETWGNTTSRLLDEGAATYTDNECYYENPFLVINAHFHSQDMLFELRELVENFDASAVENDIIAYLQSAGYFKYLYEQYGVDKMKLLWTEGFESFEDIYDLTLEELDRNFKSQIPGTLIPDNFDEELILTTGCG